MFRARIVEGKVTFGPVILARLKEWASVHEGAWLTLSEDKATRSHSQNAYYWVYLGVIERETGQLATDVHEWAKRKFLPPRFITVNGEEIKIPGSTRDMSKSDFADYLEKIAAEVEIALPDREAAGFLPHT